MSSGQGAQDPHEPVEALRSDDGTGLADRVVEALRGVADPCCRERGISVVDMGLLEGIAIDDDAARIQLVLTSGWCPFAVDLIEEVRRAVESLPDIHGARVELVWDTAWTADRLSADARRKLRFLPPPSEVADRGAYDRAARTSAPPAARPSTLRTDSDDDKER